MSDVARAREEYAADPATFAENHTRQDAAILNIQRACEAALDMGQHLIRRERLGIPQSARDVFGLLFFVKAAAFEMHFGVVLPHPGNDVFGVQADFIAKAQVRRDFTLKQLHRTAQEEFGLTVRHFAQ